MVNHNVMRLHIPMHDSFAVAEIQSLQKLIDIETNIIVRETRVKRPEIGIVNVFKDQTRRLALIIADNIEQGYHVWPTCQILEDLDLTLDLLLLDGFKDLNDTFLVVHNINAFKYFRVFSAAYKARKLACLVSSAILWRYRRLRNEGTNRFCGPPRSSQERPRRYSRCRSPSRTVACAY